ncbi:hypothetical protein Patl1_19477 [Pistacia atlantica]|uniref:Uncharacterized protein n=1 Tax=Pistacia atlantica TaxID=434234 RepID=A0ACC1C240_9ROSI|nr:hypothetical protein Patl1_19477 [Pistacia atlantica]
MQSRLEKMRRSKEERRNLSQSVPATLVPYTLRIFSFGSVLPEVVSIGPLHRNNTKLLLLEEFKWFFLDIFLRRAAGVHKYLYDLLLEMKSLEAQTRDFYSQNQKCVMSNEDFIQMMLVDGCFLIELLCYHNRDEIDEVIDDPILARPNLIPALASDVLKIENQLPLFVLKSLFDQIGLSDEKFMKLALDFLNLSWTGPTMTFLPEFLRCSHLLEIFYFSLVQQVSGNNGDECDKTYASTHSMQCVTELKLSGIKFKQRKAKSFLDIKFKNRALLIPSITLNDMMSTVLINCMALEQSRDYHINYISDYVSFLSCLISQPRDVSSLSSDGIIPKFSHNDKYVADFFNKLGKNTVYIRQGYLSNQIQNVEAYYNSYWASLMRNYFNTPWSAIKLFAASFLLGCSHRTQKSCSFIVKQAAKLQVIIMAFFGKVGSILRQTAGSQIARLSYSADHQSLKEAFSKYGYVAEDPEDLALLHTALKRRPGLQ